MQIRPENSIFVSKPLSCFRHGTRAIYGQSLEATTWKPLKPILKEWFGDDVDNLASAANLWRNELAHEKREYQPNVDVITAVRLVEHLNYCIVLRYAGYNDEEIKAILSDILTR